MHYCVGQKSHGFSINLMGMNRREKRGFWLNCVGSGETRATVGGGIGTLVESKNNP